MFVRSAILCLLCACLAPANASHAQTDSQVSDRPEDDPARRTPGCG